jgi:5'-3' exonuclease
VKAKSVKTGDLVDEAAVVAKFGVRPDQMRDYLTLVGDKSDNVAGAKGIGEKRAADLLAKFDTLDNIYTVLDANEGKPTAGHLHVDRNGVEGIPGVPRRDAATDHDALRCRDSIRASRLRNAS